MKIVQQFLKKLNYIRPSNATPRYTCICIYIPKRIYVHIKTCMQTFIAALFTVAGKRKQLKRPTDEWINKMQCVYIRQYHLRNKKHGVPLMNLKHMMLGFPANALVENHLPMQEMQEMQVLPLGGKIPWRTKWTPTPVFLPEVFHRQRSLTGYSPWGRRVEHN